MLGIQFIPGLLQSEIAFAVDGSAVKRRQHARLIKIYQHNLCNSHNSRPLVMAHYSPQIKIEIILFTRPCDRIVIFYYITHY